MIVFWISSTEKVSRSCKEFWKILEMRFQFSSEMFFSKDMLEMSGYIGEKILTFVVLLLYILKKRIFPVVHFLFINFN